MKTFESFLNEGYGPGDKKALLDDLAKSIENLQHSMPQKSVILGTPKVISDTEIEIELNFEIITLKVTKIKAR